MPPFAAPPAPYSDNGATDLTFPLLIPSLPGDDVFFAEGAFDDRDEASLSFDNPEDFDDALEYLVPLGELADVAPKAASPVTSLKTRNYSVMGKRTTTIEITIAGMSNVQKEYLESTAFSGSPKTIVLTNRDRSATTVFNGRRWVAEWKGEIDGIPTFTLSSEFTGPTSNSVFVFPLRTPHSP